MLSVEKEQTTGSLDHHSNLFVPILILAAAVMPSNQPSIAAPTPQGVMTKLSSFVSVYEPATTTSRSSQDAASPKLVVVASWMDARDLHIAKYIDQYRALYPTSKILVVKFIFQQMLFDSVADRAVEPAVSYLRSLVDSGYLSSSSSQPEILAHVFSNGGVASTKHLFNSYHEKTGLAFPLHAAVYDSCPGGYSYSKTHNAIMAGFPAWRWIVAPLVHLLNMYLWVFTRLGRPYGLITNPLFHNDPKEKRETNRTYIYGTNDVMVDWRHVEAHAREAEAKGFVVRREVFLDSAHVAHVRSDKSRYWKIVTETWSRARSGE